MSVIMVYSLEMHGRSSASRWIQKMSASGAG